DTLQFIRSEGAEGGPYLVHAITKKGKGYKLAEELPLKYHGVTSFKINDGIQSSGVKTPNYQDIFADTLIKLAKEDPRIVAITAAMPSGTGINKFQKEFPNRTYDVGIAESHAVLFAAGLATEGYRPVAAIYSTFLQRAYDQIIHDVGIQNLPVIFAMDRGGLVGADGATHQGAFDLSYLRAIPNFVVMAPKDENELQNMIKTAIHHQTGPIALRYPRGEVAGVKMDKEPICLPIGKGELISADGDDIDVCLISVGYSVQSSLEAQRLLREKGIKTALINARFIKPLDEELILYWANRSRLLVTVEENAAMGGFGSGVLELLQARHLQKDCLILGLPDQFIEHAAPKAQRAMTFLDGPGIFLKTFEKLQTLDLVPKTKPKTKKAEKESSLALQ
ncbi:MAG: transketolase C-terminal domain-containing protein, partial [Deltaproteobacteria bacterium]